MNSVCSKCGIIKRSGKASCCGHGGSWFENCGSVDSATLDHTWKDGIQACKSQQSQAVLGHQQHVSRPESRTISMNDKAFTTAAHGFTPSLTDKSTPMPGTMSIAMSGNMSVTTPGHKFISEAIGPRNARNIQTSRSMPTSKSTLPRPAYMTIGKTMQSASAHVIMKGSQVSASTSITTREYEKLFYVFTHVSTIVIVVFSC